MINNNCLEKLKVYKLEHQAWFNDIHKRLNLLLVDKKKVKFESLAKVASKWIIPVSSDLKNLQGITEIQKLILFEVQVYKKIIELINKPLKGSLFESKNKTIQKRDNTLIMHAEAMAGAYNNIVKAFNNLEKEIITKKVQCKPTTVSKAQIELENKKETELKVPSNTTTSKTAKTEQKTSKEQTDTVVKETIQKNTTVKKLELVKEPIVLKDETAISDNTISMENMLNQNLLDTLNQNRKDQDPKETEVTEIFNLQEEIKRIVG